MTSQTSDSLAHTREDRAWRTQEERRKLGQDLGERVFLERRGPRTRAGQGWGRGAETVTREVTQGRLLELRGPLEWAGTHSQEHQVLTELDPTGQGHRSAPGERGRKSERRNGRLD